jgi:hypothetical protein
MTNRAQLEQLLNSRPFRPFWLETVGGTQIRVAKSSRLWMPDDNPYSFVVFNDNSTYTVLNYADLTDTITVEDPTREG